MSSNEINELKQKIREIEDPLKHKNSFPEDMSLNGKEDIKASNETIVNLVKAVYDEIDKLSEKIFEFLDKKQEERSESEVVFLNEYKDKLTDLKKQRDHWVNLLEKAAFSNNEYSISSRNETIADFLRITLPPIPYEPPFITSSRDNILHHRPKTVSRWLEFRQGASLFEYPTDSKPKNVVLPETSDYIILEEIPDLQVVIHTHLDNFNRIFKNLGLSIRFQSCVHDNIFAFSGKPVHLLCDGNKILSFIEDVAPWDLPVLQNKDLVDMFMCEKDGIEMDQVEYRQRKFIMEIIEQFYGYLSLNNLKYGMLTSYNVSYFLTRPSASTLLISDPIYNDQTAPTLMECIYYFATLCIENHKSPEIDQLSDIQMNTNCKQEWNSNQISEPPAKRQRIVTPETFQNRKYLGEGSSGQVFLCKSNEFEYAVKVVDIYNNKEGELDLQTEIKVYKKLANVNLDLIPKYHGEETLFGQHFLIMEYIKGRECNESEMITYRRTIRMYARKLKALGVIHNDIRPANVLVCEDGNIKLIDFGRAEIIG